MERMMDRIARELKLDRAEVRRRNLIPKEKMPYTKPLKARSGAAMQYDSGDYPGSQAMVLKAAGWDDFPKRQAEARAQGRYIGIGLAHGIKGTGRGPFESGIVRVSNTGKVTVFTGAANLGQGLRTVLAQIAASELGLRSEDITVVPGDTSGAALGLGAFASRQMVTAGNSVLLASRQVAEKAKKLASHILEAAEHDLELKDGEVRVVGAPQLSVKFAELSRILKGAPGYGFPPGVEPGLDANVNWRTDALAYANTCHAAEVEVDVETGAVRILNYVALQDSGVLINPMLVEGQLQGGIAHGIGNALFEWMGYDDAAQPVTTTFADYLLPTATEIPNMTAIFQETPSPLNPLGCKGAGEVSTIPTAAAIINAIEDALQPFNVRIEQTPLPPQKIVELIHGGGNGSAGH
jgi:carbon-monoxide dehydrogenase large subunit